MSLKFGFKSLAVLFLLTGSTQLPAANIDWTGATSDLTLNTNWLGGVTPTVGDIGVFDGSVGPSTTPTVINTGFANTWTPSGLVFTTDDISYNFVVDALGVTAAIQFDTVGVINNVAVPPALQTFNVINGGNITFIGGSADNGSSGLVTYNFGASGVNACTMSMTGTSKAGAAHINLGLAPLVPSALTFASTASAENAVIQSANSSFISFSTQSTAAQATLICTGNLSTSFTANSTPGAATINITNAPVTFDTTIATSTAKLFLASGADCQVLQNIGFDRVVSDATSPITLNGTASLTVANPTDGDTIAGTINGGASNGFIKGGANTLILSNVNVYGGGTAINGGTLQLTNALAAGVGTTITFGGTATLQFGNSFGLSQVINLGTNIGTFDTQGFNGALTGVISNGSLAKTGSGTLTLTNSNTYAGLTSIRQGTLALGPVGTIAATSSVSMGGNGISVFDVSATAGPTVNIGNLNGDSQSTIILGANNLIATVAANSVFAGAITGAGAFEKKGAAVLTLAGPNSYTGGTTVTAGILQGDTTSLQGNIINNATTIFNQSIDGTYAGQLSGTGALQKNGTGLVNLTGNSSAFSGLTSVQQGELALNNILGGNLVVNSTGILSGNGTLLGNMLVNNGGTIAPGNSIGTLVIGGSYAQVAGSTYQAEINGSGQSDLISIAGTASLGGTLEIISLDGVINTDVTYTLLHANGGVTGTYASVVSTNPLISPTVTYTSNDVLLKTKSIFNTLKLTYNEQQVANQLISITNASPELQEILDELAALAGNSTTARQAKKALDQMSGQQYSLSLVMAEQNGRQFLRRLYDPLRSIVTALPCQSCCQNEGFDFCSLTFDQAESWLEAGGGHSSIHGNGNCSGLKLNTYQVSAGSQASIDDFTAGIAVGYVHDKIHYNVGGSGTNNSTFAALYGLYRPCGWYLLGDVAYGCMLNKVKRTIDIGTLHYTARSKPKIHQFFGYIEGGFDLCYRSLLIQPFLGFEGGHFNRNKICESGAAPINLSLASKSCSNAFSRLGLHLTTKERTCQNISFSLDLSWAYRLTNNFTNFNEHFQSFGDTFLIKGVSPGRNSIDAAFTVSTEICDDWMLFAEASGSRWSNNFTYNLLAGVKYSW